MTGRTLSIASVLMVGAALTFTRWAEPIPAMPAPAPIAFVCRNGVAMSIWSAAYFNRLATARGIRERAISRAATPSYTRMPLHMTLALAIDGFRLDGYRPQVVSGDDAQGAERIIVIDDAVLPPPAHTGAAPVEVWEGFPPMREQYFPSRRALKARVEALVDRLAQAQP